MLDDKKPRQDVFARVHLIRCWFKAKSVATGRIVELFRSEHYTRYSVGS